MTEILIALPVDHSSIILADKLNSDSNFKVTFYVDPLIDSEFQSSAINDIQSVCPDPVKTIQNKVCKSWLLVYAPPHPIVKKMSCEKSIFQKSQIQGDQK